MNLITNEFAFYIWAIIFLVLLIDIIILVDLNKKKYDSSLEKLIWISLIIFFPLIGCLLYLSMGRGTKKNISK